MHTRDVELIAHFMECDIAYVEKFIENASLMSLYARYIVKFCKMSILHKYRPPYVDDASFGDDPYVTIPVKDLVEHDEKEEKQICLKEPEKIAREDFWIKPMIDSPCYCANRHCEPEEDIWQSNKEMPMKNSLYFIAGCEVSLKKMML